MAGIHFYTITDDKNKKFRGVCPYYQWDKVEEFFDTKRENIKRGSLSGLPIHPRCFRGSRNANSTTVNG